MGLAPTEVATVGLVALAGGHVARALGVLTGSLVVSAVGGSLAMSAAGERKRSSGVGVAGAFLAGCAGPVGRWGRCANGRLLDRRRRAIPRGTVDLSVVELVYASLSAATDAAQLGQAVVARVAFIAASGVLGVVLLRKLAAGMAAALCASMRDFAVVAALATPAVGASAGTVAGVYAVLVLVLGAAASWLRQPCARNAAS